MNTIGVATGMVFVFGGVAAVLAAGWRSHARSRALVYLTEADGQDGEGAEVVFPPFAERILRPFARSVTVRIRDLFPSRHLDRLHRQLLHAGLSRSLRAEEMATIQVVVAALATTTGLAVCAFGSGSIGLKLFLVMVMVISALFAPPAWLARRIRKRTDAIERDLPDVLDLLTIAVEAGLGLEQAMEAACADLKSPITDELAHTLQEMGLGLSRQKALENLKGRTDSSDLASFVLVLTQADVLGMPIGRVLRSQADEMRSRRRARAREMAGKLPVKILFPLLFFILPPLMIIVIGPAVASIARLFGI